MRVLTFFALVIISFIAIINILLCIHILFGIIDSNPVQQNISMETLGGITGYAYLIEDSTVNIEIILNTPPEKEYYINISFTHIGSGEKWNWSSSFLSSKPLTPKFITPVTGLYKYSIRISTHSKIPLSFRIQLKIKDGDTAPIRLFEHFLPGMLVLSMLSFVLSVLDYVFSRKRIIRRLFLNNINWELQGNFRHYITLLFTVFLLTTQFKVESIFSTIHGLLVNYVDVLLPTLYSIVVPKGIDMMWLLLFIYVIVVFLTIYSYEVETGIYREYILLGINRFKLYSTKLVAGILLSIIPFLISNSLLISMYTTDLLIHKPCLWLIIIGKTMFIEIITLAVLLSIVLLVVSIPLNTPYKILLALLIPYLLSIFMPHNSKPTYLFIVKYSGYSINYFVEGCIPYLLLLPFTSLIFTLIYILQDYH